MYVCKKPNPSEVVSVRAIDKSSGKYKLLVTIGTSSNPLDFTRLESEANQWIKTRFGEIEINFKMKKVKLGLGQYRTYCSAT